MHISVKLLLNPVHQSIPALCLQQFLFSRQFLSIQCSSTVISQVSWLVKNVGKGNSCSVRFNSMVWSRSSISAVTRLLSQHWGCQNTILSVSVCSFKRLCVFPCTHCQTKYFYHLKLSFFFCLRMNALWMNCRTEWIPSHHFSQFVNALTQFPFF